MSRPNDRWARQPCKFCELMSLSPFHVYSFKKGKKGANQKPDFGENIEVSVNYLKVLLFYTKLRSKPRSFDDNFDVCWTTLDHKNHDLNITFHTKTLCTPRLEKQAAWRPHRYSIDNMQLNKNRFILKSSIIVWHLLLLCKWKIGRINWWNTSFCKGLT